MRHMLAIVRHLAEQPGDPDALRAAGAALQADPNAFVAALREHYVACDAAQLSAASPAADLQALETRVPTWVNHGGNQRVFARELLNPTSLADLRRIVREVGARKGRLKPVGSGHSFSDIVQTDDALINIKSVLGPNQPSSVLRLEDELWKDPTPATPRVRVICGATIHALNPVLATAGLGFANLGGYDAQTLIGAIATSTHGSGLGLPPLPDAVRSLVLVTTAGKVYQIEPSDGITDPDKFYRRYRREDIELKQDDRWFQSVVVSMGCMGIIYSITLDVVASYMLQEDVSDEAWSSLRPLVQQRSYLAKYRHLEVHLNPHPAPNGDYRCSVVRRNLAPGGSVPHPLPAVRRLLTMLAFSREAQRLLVRALNEHPDLVPGVLDGGFTQLVTGAQPNLEASYKIYNLGDVNKADVTALEFAFPLENGVYLAAIDRLIEIVAQNRARGLYQNGPLALRFVKASKAYLSMMYGRDSCTCEIAMLNGTRGGDEMLLSYEKAMYEFQARLHWGQRNELTGTPGWLEDAYPHAEAWLEVYRELNSQGVFNNHFTDRMGISVYPEENT
jgi:FAD/FMN-containing dehydrogenase